MVKLSSYSNGYDDGKFELMPWEFWTEEEKSFVISRAYQKHYLTSKQVQNYLQISRTNMLMSVLVPAAAGGAYFGFFKHSLVKNLFRYSPYQGVAGGVIFVAVTAVLWGNLSPFYIRKENAQQKLLDVLYHKIGVSMKTLNDGLPRSRTSGEYDRKTMFQYFQRNYIFTEIGDDFMPPLMQKNATYKYASKKMYL